MIKEYLIKIKKTWKLQIIPVILSGIIMIGFYVRELSIIDRNNNNINGRVVDMIEAPFDLMTKILDYGEEYTKKFPFDKTRWEDYINFSGLRFLSDFLKIDELRLHYDVSPETKKYYENYMTNQLSRNISIFQVTPENIFDYSTNYPVYCPLTYISPNTSDVLHKYIGADICNTFTFENFTKTLLKTGEIELQSRKIIRNNGTVFDVGKKIKSGYIIASILTDKLITSIHEKIEGEYYIQIKNVDEVIYKDSEKNKKYLKYYKTINSYGKKMKIYTLHESYTNIWYFFIGVIIIIPTSCYFIIYFTDINDLQLKIKQYEYSNELLGYINHELRNPLNSIQGLITITRDDISKLQVDISTRGVIESNLHTAEKACFMMNHIINDILDMVKLQKGKMKLDYTYVNVEDLFIDIKKVLLNKIQENPSINFEFYSNIEIILTDRYRILQILLNFLSNSFKFTDTGKIILDFKECVDHIIISVEDTGCGIKNPKHLFKPYEQTSIKDSIRHGGMGLGLYICKMLADLMKMEIGFYELKNGSRFYIKIKKNVKID